MKLLIKPKKDSQEIVSVTPRSAGWRYISFSAHKLSPGETVSFSDTSNELCVVVLSGIVTASSEGYDWKEIGGRMSVFEDAAPYAVYLPPGAKVTVTSKTESELGVAGGPADGSAACQAYRTDGDAPQRSRHRFQYEICLRYSAAGPAR